MSVSELPIAKDEEKRRQARRETAGPDRSSARLRRLIVVFAGLALCSGVFLVASWLF